jgi:ATP-dependent DNA ligase
MEDLRNKLDIEASRCRGAYMEDAPEYIWGHPHWALEPKEDGDRITLQIGSLHSLLVGRNRQDFLKGVARAGLFRVQNETNQDLAAIACKDLDGTILDGELTDLRKLDGTQEKTTIDRIKNGDFIGYTVWQVLTVRGKDVRDLPDWKRREVAGKVIKYLKEVAGVTFPIRLIDRVPATKENLEAYLNQGIEGVIAKNTMMPIPKEKKSGKYQRTNTWWWKIKGDKKRTVDGFIIGVTEAMSGGSGVHDIARQPNGKAATFTMAMIRKDGKVNEVVEVAKMFNLPEEAVERGFEHFDEFKGKVAEMQVSGWDGARFRWPRFVKWRPDKTKGDCLFDEQVGRRNE